MTGRRKRDWVWGRTQKERNRRWERWKREAIAGAPDKDREWWRELLEGMDPPTEEDERRMRDVRKLVEKAFGHQRRCLRRGVGGGPSRKRRAR